MSILNCTVTRNQTFTEDSRELIRISKERLHNLGEPLVTVETTDLLDTEDIKDDAVTTAKILDANVTLAKLAAALQDLIPYLTVSVVDATGNAGTCTIQVKDAAGNNLAERFLIRTWIADAEYSEPDPQTDYSVSTGELMRELEADADYEVISDASGTVVMDIATSGAKTVYCMAEILGRIYTGTADITT